MKPEYINSDLELRSRTDLSELVSVLSRKLHVIFSGRDDNHYLATFETLRNSADPDKVANQFCAVIESLPAKHRLAWKKCLSRNLDMGFHQVEVTPLAQRL